MIKALTFDLDDTLWDVAPVIQQANVKLLAWMTDAAPKFVDTYGLEGFNSLKYKVLEQQPELAHNMTQLRIALLELGLSKVGYMNYKQLAAEGFQVYFAARNQVTLFPHALEALRALSEDFIMGALSNGNADVKLVGLGQVFDFSFNASEVGVSKPVPAMFHRALEYTQLAAHEVIHIGDHPVADIQGAHDVGMHTIWANFNDDPWPDPQNIVSVEITGLDQLQHAVSRINDPCCAFS